MLKRILIFILFILMQCKYDKDGIIRIELNKRNEEQLIFTKNGLINYIFNTYLRDDIGAPIAYYYDVYYKLANIKNLNLTIYNPKTSYINISGKNKDVVYLRFGSDIPVELSSYNEKLCELFYQTKYIDKKIFAIEISGKRPFKYFGGIPTNIKENLSKFTFYKNDTVSEVEILFKENNNNNKNIKIDLIDNNKVEFKDDSHLICLSYDIFYKLKYLLFYKYKKSEYIYDKNFYKYSLFDLTPEQKKIFPDIKFKIRNITISLNKNDLIYEDSIIHIKGDNRKEDIHNYLFIKESPCDNIIFGLKLLEKFDIREYDLKNEEFNLYLEKNKNFVTKEDIVNLKFNSYPSSFISFIILLFTVLGTISVLYINNQKNKIIDYNGDYII